MFVLHNWLMRKKDFSVNIQSNEHLSFVFYSCSKVSSVITTDWVVLECRFSTLYAAFCYYIIRMSLFPYWVYQLEKKNLPKLLRSGDLIVLLASYGHAYLCISKAFSTVWSHTEETMLLHMMTTWCFLTTRVTCCPSDRVRDRLNWSEWKQESSDSKKSPFLFSPIPSLFKSSTAQRVPSVVLIGIMLADQMEREGLWMPCMSSLLSLALWRTVVSCGTDK